MKPILEWLDRSPTRAGLIALALAVLCVAASGGMNLSPRAYFWNEKLDAGAFDNPEVADCQARLPDFKIPDGTPTGQLVITGVWPPRTLMGYNLCVGVANVATEPPKKPADAIDLNVHMNSHVFKDLVVRAKPIAANQVVLVRLDSDESAVSQLAKDWAQLLRGGIGTARIERAKSRCI